ncbi:MAG: prepilin peptidase [Anaerolineales bacterium]|nr:MAG: prepilin peptidase [Anaerolineales bacterium]
MSIETFVYALIGWLVGVFINHAADVLPRRMGLGASPRCAFCDTPRSQLAWSTVIGYLTAHRACPECGAPLPLRSVIVELLMPAIFVGLLWRYGPSVHLGLLSLYSAILILVTVTDLEHHLIQHVIMAPAILLATAGAFFNHDLTWRRALLGGATGFVSLYAMFLFAQPMSALLGRLSGREISEVPFGFGDVTLGTFVGLITGLPGFFFALFITLLSAGLAALVYLFVRAVVQRRYSLFTPIPYGPFLVLGGFVMMVYGTEVLQWYIGRAI